MQARHVTGVIRALAFGSVSIAMLAGCSTAQFALHEATDGASRLGLLQRTELSREHNWVVPGGSRFAVAGSEQHAVSAMAGQMRLQFPFTKLLDSPMSLEEARAMALLHNADYLLYLGTESPDHVSVTMMEVRHWQVMDRSLITVSPGLLDFYTPLDPAYGRYVSRLSGAAPSLLR